MKKSKALLSATLAAALLVSAAAPAAAVEAPAKSEAAAPAQTSEASSAAFSWDNATVYFLLTDRFKNGDTSNDAAYGRMKTVAGSDWATFHGGDFAGITQEIEAGYFDDLGVNAIWLTAPYEQLHGYCLGGNSGNQFAHYSYHGYYVLDYTEPDKAYGTKDEFKKMVDTAHEHGIRIIMDIVMNHAGYNTLQDMSEFGFGTLKSGWESDYNSGNFSTYHSYVDYDNNAADWAKWWGPDWIRSGVAGYSEQPGSDTTNCLSGLPDFKTESKQQVGIPALLQTKWTKEGTLSDKQAKYGSSNTVTGFISTWLSAWVREYGVDGFRCDTAKHVEKSDWKILKDACTKALAEWKAANPDKKLDDLPFWMTGEHWGHGSGKDEYYTTGGFDSMINFETQGGGYLAAGQLGGVYTDYAQKINSDPSFNLLSYVSSHDSTLANRGQDMYHIGSALLMLPGGVQIYYGDESNRQIVGNFDGDGGAGHSLRSDMNWGSIDQELLAHWQKVGTFRRDHLSVGGGANVALTASSGTAFGRTYSKGGVDDKIAAVVDATANTDVTITVTGVFEDGTTLFNRYDETTDTVSGGQVTFNSGAHGTILLEEGEADPVQAKVEGAATFDDSEDVTVTLEGVSSAVMTIDGVKKLSVQNGSKVTIGKEAYPGDTVAVTLTYTHPTKGELTKKFSFKKNGSTGQSATSRSDAAIVHIKTEVAGANLYSWKGEGGAGNEFTGAWPGKALSTKDEDGWYVETLDASYTDAFNIIINAGGAQSDDIKGLKGETWVIAESTSSIKTFDDKRAAYEAAGIELPADDFEALKKTCKEIKYLADAGTESGKAALATVEKADALIAQGADKADPAAVTAAYKEAETALEAVKSGVTPDPVPVPVDSDSDVPPTPVESDSDVPPTPVESDSDVPPTPVESDSDVHSDTPTPIPVDSDSDTPTPIPSGKGDLNGDGQVTLRDASVAQKHAVGLVTLTAAQITAGDMNGDGAVTLLDAYAIQSAVTKAFKK